MATAQGIRTKQLYGRNLGSCVCVCVLAFSFVRAEEMTARVQMTEGGPQIFVNGKAVPPRMFWGRRGSRPYALAKDEWRTFGLDFRTVVDTDRATVHMRFNITDGGVTRMRNFRLLADGEEVTTRFPRGFASDKAFDTAWNVWNPARADFARTVTNGVCEQRFAFAKGENPGDFHFYSKYFSLKAGIRYTLLFEAQGEGCRNVLPNVYCVENNGRHHSILDGESDTLISTTRKAAAAGVDFVSYGIPADVWQEGGCDFTAFDRLTDRLVAANPRVRLIPRVSVNAPGWWLRTNPDHRMQYASEHVDNGGSHAWGHGLRPDMATVSSRLYRRAAVRYITDFCRHMMERYPDNFAGIHPTGQNTHEWFYFDSWIKMNGFDPQTREAFRNYLGDSTAEVPTVAERKAGSQGSHLLDSATQARCLAFNRFQQLEMADFVAELARACRRATDGKKLVVFFYGYAYAFAAHAFGPANSGHYGLENLIRRADGAIDILCSPISYSDRAYCGTAQNMSCGETVMRHGVLWLNEDDSRTYLDMRSSDYVHEGSFVTRSESQQVMLRNTSVEAVRGFGSWWMDLPGEGWYDSEALWRMQKLLNPLDAEVAMRRLPYAPDVALVQDEESMLHCLPQSAKVNGKLISGACRTVNRAGVSHGQYLLFDILGKPLAAKLQIFQSCWCLSDAEVASLLRQKRENPAWRVWCWAAGAQDETGRENLSRMSELNGFKMVRHELEDDSRLIAKATEVGLGEGLHKDVWYGCEAKIGLAYTVADAQPNEIWACYPNGDPAIVVRKTEKGGDIFLGVPELASDLVHAFARMSGAQTYLKSADVGKVALWAAKGAFGDVQSGFGMLQAMEDVRLDVQLPNESTTFDALTGMAIGTGRSAPFDLKKGEVRVFRWKGSS